MTASARAGCPPGNAWIPLWAWTDLALASLVASHHGFGWIEGVQIFRSNRQSTPPLPRTHPAFKKAAKGSKPLLLFDPPHELGWSIEKRFEPAALGCAETARYHIGHQPTRCEALEGELS